MTLADLVRVAGARWAVEECFPAAKNETALDHYQVRKHAAWYRHVTLAMCAHAWLAVTAAASHSPPAQALSGGPGHGDPAREGASQPVDNNPARHQGTVTARSPAATAAA